MLCSMITQHYLLTVKPTSVIIGVGSNRVSPLDNVVARTGKHMAKIHDDTVKDLESKSELMALYGLLKKVGDRSKALDILSKVNYYPDPETFAKANTMVRAEKSAMKELNRFFGFN